LWVFLCREAVPTTERIDCSVEPASAQGRRPLAAWGARPGTNAPLPDDEERRGRGPAASSSQIDSRQCLHWGSKQPSHGPRLQLQRSLLAIDGLNRTSLVTGDWCWLQWSGETRSCSYCPVLDCLAASCSRTEAWSETGVTLDGPVMIIVLLSLSLVSCERHDWRPTWCTVLCCLRLHCIFSFSLARRTR